MDAGYENSFTGVMSVPVRPWHNANSAEVFDNVILDDERDGSNSFIGRGDSNGNCIINTDNDALSELVLQREKVGGKASGSTVTVPSMSIR